MFTRIASSLARLHTRLERAPDSPLLHDDGRLYMDRWWLVKPRWWTFGISARVHFIASSDDDRFLHDHPWWNVSILLRGCYTEVTPRNGPQAAPEWWAGEHSTSESVRVQFRRAGSIVFRKAESRHRLELDAGPVWTIFITDPWERDWGFTTPQGWVWWRDWVGRNEEA